MNEEKRENAVLSGFFENGSEQLIAKVLPISLKSIINLSKNYGDLDYDYNCPIHMCGDVEYDYNYHTQNMGNVDYDYNYYNHPQVPI